ncbi:MAG: hypothetical protein V8R82_01380 [Clostridia bacterium]
MQDKIRIELTEKEIILINNSVDEFMLKLDNMTKDERLVYFKEMCPENNLNFEKEINGKVYEVNAYFNNESNLSILNQLYTIMENQNNLD